VCVANQKGGAGKTTTAINLAVGAAKGGSRSLLIDLDPQCNATSGLGYQPAVRHALVQCDALAESLVETSTPGLMLLPGSRRFEDVELLAGANEASSALVARHLASSGGAYDLVFVDCPPSLGTLTQTALAGGTEVLMPIQCEYFAMEGLTQMIEVIRGVMQRGGNRLKFAGIVLTMYDHMLELTREVEHEVREFFGDIVYSTVIPRDVAVAEAPSHGLAVLDYAPRSRGARAYVELCMEVLERV
jgi:chromosome partitioning protein